MSKIAFLSFTDSSDPNAFGIERDRFSMKTPFDDL